MNHKNISVKVSSAFLLVSLLLPGVMLADTNSTGVAKTLKSTFCAKIDTFITNTDKKLGQKDSTYQTKKANQAQKISESQAIKTGKLEKSRAIWNSKRDVEFVKLSNKAKTEAQKTAVSNFKQAITDAVTARQSAIDAAISVYKTGLSSIMDSRKTAVEADLTTFKTETDAVLAKAKTDCDSGIQTKIIKTSTTSGLKDARTKFNSSLKDTAQMKSDLKSLSNIRKTSFVKAQSDFKTISDATRLTLKAAFK